MNREETKDHADTSESGGAAVSADRERFEAFHRANPEVWKQFESGCMEMIDSGRTKFGAPVVWERIRWESSVGSKSGSFRLPNEHRPHYARLFQNEHPDLASHIATRPLKSERGAEPDSPREEAAPESEPSADGGA